MRRSSLAKPDRCLPRGICIGCVGPGPCPSRSAGAFYLSVTSKDVQKARGGGANHRAGCRRSSFDHSWVAKPPSRYLTAPDCPTGSRFVIRRNRLVIRRDRTSLPDEYQCSARSKPPNSMRSLHFSLIRMHRRRPGVGFLQRSGIILRWPKFRMNFSVPMSRVCHNHRGSIHEVPSC